jgi:uncharacterized protein (TIGR04255 family)
MATRGKPIPKKLKRDAIVEAVFEIRFDMTTLAEILVARFADSVPWKAFDQHYMPVHELPASLREGDPNLRYQPVFELAEATEHRAVRIGQHVLSYHRTAPYVGWQRFQLELHEIIETLFAKVDGLSIIRLGFRYINALQTDPHGIRRLSDLDLTLAVSHEAIAGSVNINFTTSVSDNTQCIVRIATADLVQGALPPATSILIDVDVSTKDSFKTTEANVLRDWVEFAHTIEKEQFFRLLTDETIDTLKEN